MKTNTRWLSLPLAATLLTLPALAQGQGIPRSTRQYPEMDSRHDRAVAMVTTTSHDFHNDLRQAAALHQMVADQRTLDDARGFDCMVTQASFLLAIGDLPGARRYIEAAAVQAESTGDYMNAARAYISSARLADEADDLTNAAYFARMAGRIASSRKVTFAQRDELLAQLGNVVFVY